ncbi:MAG: S-layer homology domain-containing protein [Patescibacteria group bacterium]
MKRLLAFVFVNVFVFGVFSSALAFSDVSQDAPLSKEIYWLTQNKVVKGYSDGTFRPDATVNRAEILKIVFLALGLGAEVEEARTEMTNALIGFSDVNVDQWFAPYVYLAKKRGSVQGYPDGTFRPGNAVKRSEAFKIVLNEFYNNEVDFTGDSEVGDVLNDQWFWKYANFAAFRDLFDGDKFDGGTEMTRGTTAQLVYRTRSVKDNIFRSEKYIPTAKPMAIPDTQFLARIQVAMPDYTAVNIQGVGEYVVFFGFETETYENAGWYRLSTIDKNADAVKLLSGDLEGIDMGASSPDGKEFLITHADGSIKVIDMDTLEQKSDLGIFSVDGKARYSSPIYTPDGKYILLREKAADNVLVVNADTKNIQNGTTVGGFMPPGIGGGEFESGYTYSDYTFYGNTLVKIMYTYMLDLSTMEVTTDY